jgi:GNAT superfamily N-acetyltransferase
VSDSIIEPLGSGHDRAAFSCGTEALDRYLKQQASQDARNRVAAPFVLRNADSQRIIGFYTLSSFAIDLSGVPPDVAKRLPRYPQMPVVLIGRLAVDRDFGGQGWGKALLIDALKRSLQYSHQVAAMAVVVDAKDDSARAFYERFGFQHFTDQEYRLFLPMRTIEQLFPMNPTAARRATGTKRSLSE